MVRETAYKTIQQGEYPKKAACFSCLVKKNERFERLSSFRQERSDRVAYEGIRVFHDQKVLV